MAIRTATEVMQYNDNSVNEATVIAVSFNFSSLIRTKNTISEIIVKTITIIPTNNPVFARVQSTE